MLWRKLTCGDFNTWEKGLDETLYTLHMIPVEIHAGA
jgi:hypothetical protein